MICFQDRTFCGSKNCKNLCGRKFTKELHKQAVKWWGSDEYPVAYSTFCGTPTILEEAEFDGESQ
jgi:hypothetical protein